MAHKRFTTGSRTGNKLVVFAVWAVTIIAAAFVSEWIYPYVGLSKDYRIVPLLILGAGCTALVVYLENKFMY
jgi:hypothetical protein